MLLFSLFSYDDLLAPAGCAGDMSLLQFLSGGWLALVAMAFQGNVGGGGLLDLSLSAHGGTIGDCSWQQPLRGVRCLGH